ncbi:hypothetical protein BH09ACT8_BH09ACT8_14820 [soil metagenome]
MPDTSFMRRQASFDEVDLQLAVRTMAAEKRPSLSVTAPLPVADAVPPETTGPEPHQARSGLLLPGGLLGLSAALLVIAALWLMHQPTPHAPTVTIPVGPIPAQAAPVPVAPPSVATPPAAQSIVVDTTAAASPPAPPVDAAPTVGMPQQRLRSLLTRLADRRQ